MNALFRVEGLAPARPVMAAAAARGFKRPPRRTVDRWAREERIVAEESGSPFPGPWGDAAPHLDEVMEVLSLSHPSRRVVFMGSSQIAKSEAGLNLIGASIVDEPAPILVVLPTTGEVGKYLDFKLDPMISATPSVRRKVREEKSRDEDGSTRRTKKFPGGSLQITHASSSAGLQMITVRIVIFEEPSEYEADVGGRGSPIKQGIKRTDAWTGREKIYIPGTPKLDGECVISAEFEASDQRRRYVPCPHCGDFQVLTWERMEKASPVAAAFPCVSCGAVIEPGQRFGMLRKGVWLKCFPGEGCPPAVVRPEEIDGYRTRASDGREPGFHLWAAYSFTKSWADIVQDWLDVRTPDEEKTFVNQVLGLAYAPQYDAPDHEKIAAAADKAGRHAFRVVPDRALILTGACDVQGDRLEWAVKAFDEAATSWDVDRGVLEGDPTDVAVWRRLDEILTRRWSRRDGRAFELDAFGVDTGYLSQSVYRWARRHAHAGRVFALKGQGGWMQMPIGTPSRMAVDHAGKKIGEVAVYPVGTWDLKAELYAGIAKLIAGPDQGVWPPGTCFFSDAADEAYFRQLTAEHVVEEVNPKTGRSARVWKKLKGQPNEQHDLAVYARALFRHLTNRLMPEDWHRLIAARRPPELGIQPSLEALWSAPRELAPRSEADEGTPNGVRADVAPGPEVQAPDREERSANADWLNGRGGEWF